MQTTDADAALAALAVAFPAWHIWRSRDRQGRDDGWNATRRARPGPEALAAGIVARIAAGDHAGLRSQLEQQRVVESGAERAA
jgi:hypothetical protein